MVAVLEPSAVFAAFDMVEPITWNIRFRPLPANCAPTKIAKATNAAMRPYSMAVAPDSDEKNLRILFMIISKL